MRVPKAYSLETLPPEVQEHILMPYHLKKIAKYRKARSDKAGFSSKAIEPIEDMLF